MIDYPDHQAMPASHYECTIPRNYAGERQVKQKVFKYMNQLEGWCTQNKASVLMDLIFNHNPQVVVEVGIWGGKSFIPMAEALKYLNNGVIYGIDPWKAADSVVGFDDANRDWWGKVDHNRVMKDFLRKRKAFKLENYSSIIRATSAEADPIDHIDMIHIDGNHTEESALFDVQKWVPLVRQGGFIIFDDVDWPSTHKAIEWLDENCYRITTFHEANVWGIWKK